MLGTDSVLGLRFKIKNKMNISDHTQPHKLERLSFLWSEARLVIAAFALFLGGVPPLLYIFATPSLFFLLGSLLKISWLISGIASGYLLYRWHKGGKTLFGGKSSKDAQVFFVSVVSGLNLGIAGLLGTNVGMSISSNRIVFIFVALIYLFSGWVLWKRWKANGEKVF